MLRKLAYGVCTHESVGQERSAGQGLRRASKGEPDSGNHGGSVSGQHDYKSASRRYRSIKKRGKQAIGKSKGGWTTKIHLVAADARTVVSFSLSRGQAHDAPEGRKLLRTLETNGPKRFLLMDRAYEGESTRALAAEIGYQPVVPPKQNRKDPWEYDRVIYKRRNEIERLFRRLKRFRRVATRFDKLDMMFAGFLTFCFIIDSLI